MASPSTSLSMTESATPAPNTVDPPAEGSARLAAGWVRRPAERRAASPSLGVRTPIVHFDQLDAELGGELSAMGGVAVSSSRESTRSRTPRGRFPRSISPSRSSLKTSPSLDHQGLLMRSAQVGHVHGAAHVAWVDEPSLPLYEWQGEHSKKIAPWRELWHLSQALAVIEEELRRVNEQAAATLDIAHEQRGDPMMCIWDPTLYIWDPSIYNGGARCP